MFTASWFIVTRVFKRNLLSLILIAWIGGAADLVEDIWKLGWPTFSFDLIISCVLLALPFVYLLYLYTLPQMAKSKSLQISD